MTDLAVRLFISVLAIGIVTTSRSVINWDASATWQNRPSVYPAFSPQHPEFDRQVRQAWDSPEVSKLIQGAPADAYVWSEFAATGAATAAPAAVISQAIRNSYRMAPNDCPIAIRQSLLAARQWHRTESAARESWMPFLRLLPTCNAAPAAVAKAGLQWQICILLADLQVESRGICPRARQ